MKNTKFWIATEVNHTAAHTRKTLYVAGKQPLADILRNATQNSITHVSFEPGSLDINDTYFLETVDALTVAGYTITIEYDIRQHDAVVSYFGAKMFTSRNIIPIAALGNIDINTINPNFTLAINDKSADGRWCIGPSAIMDSNRFTLFAEYDPTLAIVLDPDASQSAVETRRVCMVEVGDLSPEEIKTAVESKFKEQYLAADTTTVPEVKAPALDAVVEPPTEPVPVPDHQVEPAADAVGTAPSETSNKRKRGGTNAE